MAILHQIYHRLSGGPTVLCPYCFGKFKLGKTVQDHPVCPLAGCGREIPINAVDLRNGSRPRLIGLIGAKNSGKTHFIGSMLESIRRAHDQFDWALTGLGDAIDRYRTEFYTPIFVEHRRVPLSNKGAGKKPFTFRLSTRKASGKLSVNFLTFFDTAGESFASEELIERESNYICNSDGLILLLDPLQLPKVRELLKGRMRLPDRELDTEDIVQRTANILRRRRKIKAHDLIKTPIAITFSKLDQLLEICPAGSPLHLPSSHNGYFSRAEFEDLDAEIRSLLNEWDGSALINQVTHNFARHGFFGVSALGCQPDSSGAIGEIKPMRVLDPLLWQLSLQGNVKKLGRA